MVAAPNESGYRIMQGYWNVLRHGGRRTDRWRLVEFAASEAYAREVYSRAAAALRQGEVRLVDPTGRVAERRWAPRLRTRW